MIRRPGWALWACLLSLLPGVAWAQNQSALNPELSFIADMRALTADATPDDLDLRLEALEIYAQGYLNPFARGDVFLGIHEGEVHVEEAYVSFTALPVGLGLRVGRMLVDIGRFNPQHPHVFSFLDHPLMVQWYLGEEGYGDLGINPSALIDVNGVPLTLSAGVLSGKMEEHAHAAEDSTTQEEEDAPRDLADLAYNGRATVFFTVGDVSHLELGATVGTRMLDTHEGLRATWFGGDLKFKWRPDRRRSFTVSAELLGQSRDLEQGGTETALGFIGVGDLQFRRHWNVGALVDYAQEPEDSARDQLGVGVFAGYSLFEESTLIRLLLRRDDTPDGQALSSVQMQVTFALGPHKPHQF